MVRNSILGNWEEDVSKGPGFEKMGVVALNMIYIISWSITSLW